MILKQSNAAILRNIWKTNNHRDYSSAQVIVIGGGHAGCEAAFASARAGAETLLVTQRKDTIGEMSCNPSIGGIGKGTLVREIDALGGLMGRVADKSGINFKVLNQSKGAAVQGPRAQMDRDIYKATMQKELFKSDQSKKLTLYEGNVHDLIIDSEGKCTGISMEDGTNLTAKSVVLTTGTFLAAKCYIGQSEVVKAGRFMRHTDKTKTNELKVEPASSALADSIKRMNFPVARLRTGTPPRISKASIDYTGLEAQTCDPNISWFSFTHAFNGFQL